MTLTALMIWMAAITAIVVVLDIFCVFVLLYYTIRNSKHNDKLRKEIYAKLRKSATNHNIPPKKKQ